MNIKEAKEQIKNSIKIYLKKNQFGDYKIPLVRQRPIFLLGAPGIGKTAIMEQIAQELNIALVSYSMTHHTRQSALGLPFIEHRQYEGQKFAISEYTMSEIIASIYETMEKSSLKEGILFLDEINCISETLAPSMLQFLQYKVFGRHKVPDGWIVVTAGNPPEYNKSVREFDIVTMDRLKILEVEADYKIWREYASSKGIHGSILTYLDIKKSDFYLVESSIKGKTYVTARGWEDLSEIITLYEEENIVIDEVLVSQYLRNDKVAKEFAIYYDLYNKYKKDYKVEDILSGIAGEEIKRRAKEARFDERISLMGLLLEVLQREIKENLQEEEFLLELLKVLKEEKAYFEVKKENVQDIITGQIEQEKIKMLSLEKGNSLSESQKIIFNKIFAFLEENKSILLLANISSHKEAFKIIKGDFDKCVANLKNDTEKIKDRLHNLFAFIEDVYEDGQEILILITELTVNYYSAKFISAKGSDDYYRYNQELLFHERNQEIIEKMESLTQNNDLEKLLEE